MGFRIIGDSCTDLTEIQKNDVRIDIVPLTLEIGEYRILDDKDFNQIDFLRRMKESNEGAKSACPSPDAYLRACELEGDDIFIITLSSHLSGSYNSACIAAEMYKEKYGETRKNILVIDSESASAGQLSLVNRIFELYDEGYSFEDVSKKILEYRDSQKTYFILDSLEQLRKNGRLSGLKAMIAETLNIKPIMAGDHGVIVKLGQTRGLKKAYAKMAEYALEDNIDFSKKTLTISHCNCRDRAELVKDNFCKLGDFKSISIADTNGVATLYAGEGGVIVAIC